MHQTVRVRHAVDNLEVHHHWLQVTTRRGLGQSGFRDISPAFVQTRKRQTSIFTVCRWSLMAVVNEARIKPTLFGQLPSVLG